MSDLIPVSRRCERLARIALIVAMTLSLLFIVLAIAAVGIIYVGTRPTHGAVTEEFDFAAAIVINPFAVTLFLPALLIATARILNPPSPAPAAGTVFTEHRSSALRFDRRALCDVPRPSSRHRLRQLIRPASVGRAGIL